MISILSQIVESLIMYLAHINTVAQARTWHLSLSTLICIEILMLS